LCLKRLSATLAAFLIHRSDAKSTRDWKRNVLLNFAFFVAFAVDFLNREEREAHEEKKNIFHIVLLKNTGVLIIAFCDTNRVLRRAYHLLDL
jgi:hypothetical protein